jgi:REP element-mobilizing transposase RayT
LPHWEQQGATYFVTFRLADSLPKAVLEEYEAEREAALIRARQEGAILTDEELQRLDWLLSERIQQYLDTGAGRCSLGQPAIAALVANALRHFNGTRYRLFAWCIMPNHVHVVFQPLGDYKLQEILRSWKGFTSKEANRLLGTHGTFWEHEYYDHLIRDEADFRRIVEYVLNNPPKAGLEGWQWVEVYEWPSEAMGAGRSADVLIGRAGSNTALPALADWKVGGTPRPTEADAAFPAPADWKVGGTPRPTEADAAFPAPADWKVGGTPPAPVGVPTGVTGITESEPDDDQLRAWAREGRVLVSVIFWTGMIRELENLPRVIDLVALTRMKGGLALTLPALEYQPEGPLELLRIPLDRGGVFPHLELMLASCGLGATIESRMPEGWLAQYLLATNAAFDRLGVPLAWRPKGWWATMDAEMRPLPKPRLPITPKFQAHAPFLQLRYQSPGGQQAPAPASARAVGSAAPPAAARHPGLKRQLGDWVREHGLRAMLAPYRPYEFFAPGPLRKEVIEALRGAGLRYWFSKAGFGRPPTILYQDADVIALNYTVGHWDGWTPFETINSVADLRHAERRLLATKRPGWLVGTLDTCLWAFTGPIWERASGLRAIADFVARGGDSKRLINVTPGVIARYARLLQQ